MNIKSHREKREEKRIGWVKNDIASNYIKKGENGTQILKHEVKSKNENEEIFFLCEISTKIFISNQFFLVNIVHFCAEFFSHTTNFTNTTIENKISVIPLDHDRR